MAFSLGSPGYAANTLAGYGGTYFCPQLMQVKPVIKQLEKAKVDVKIVGAKARITIPGLNGFTFLSEEMPNGIVPGDFEYRTGGPVQLLALSAVGPMKMLNFTYDSAEMATVGTGCEKK